MKTTEEMERECNRLPLTLGYLKMRDHAKELERELEQSRKDRIAGADCSKRLAGKLAEFCLLNAIAQTPPDSGTQHYE